MSLTQERKDNVIRRVGATTGEPDVKWQHTLFTPRCHVQFRLRVASLTPHVCVLFVRLCVLCMIVLSVSLVPSAFAHLSVLTRR